MGWKYMIAFLFSLD